MIKTFKAALLAATLLLPLSLTFASCKSNPDGTVVIPRAVCETSAECLSADKPFCDGFSGCVACVLDDHCGPGLRCKEHACVGAATCTSSLDCEDPAEGVCNTILGECAECVDSSDCGNSAICDEGKCLDVTACVNSLDCAEGSVCERDYGYCVDCVDDGDCDETSTCVNLECIPRCTSDKGCTAKGELCDKEEGYCVECVEHEDCPELYHCNSGQCKADTCLQGTSRCLSLATVETCNEVGSGAALDDCEGAVTCVDDGKEAWCERWICTPGMATCDATSNQLVLCDTDGLGTSVAADCGDMDGICKDNACVDVVCEPNERFCTDTTVMQCSADGTSVSVVSDCSLFAQFCDGSVEGHAVCAPRVCTPNQSSCAANTVRKCKPDGSGYEKKVTDCEDDDKVCFNGECLKQVCEPNEYFCQDGQPQSCLYNGTQASQIDTCTSTEYCEDGLCKVQKCTPGEATCSGNQIGTCNDAGSGVDVDSSSTDCEDTGEVCWNGACLDKVCEPGARFCGTDEVRSCQNNGTSSTLHTSCGSSSYCNAALDPPACATNLCTPNAPACDANRATTCNADGSGYLATGTTCGTGELCVSGSCLPVICNASQYYCDASRNVRRCGADGTTSSLNDTCSASEHCIDGESTCKVDVCTAGQKTCDGALLATCSADGSGPMNDAVACASGQTCVGGACLSVFCTPGTRYCDGANLRTCNTTGTGYSSSTTCSTSQYCSADASGGASCKSDRCTASTATCSGEQLATCAADGGTYTNLGTDCALTGQLCNGSACVDLIEETIGSTTYSTSACALRAIGNFYTYNHERTLTEIEQYLSIPGTEQLTWFVYEAPGWSSWSSEETIFTKVFEKVTAATGAQFHSSGAISFLVQPDKSYVIGVRSSGSCTAAYSNSSTLFLSNGSPRASASFAASSSPLRTTFSYAYDEDYYYQRLSYE